jgi:hypothetical protein
MRACILRRRSVHSRWPHCTLAFGALLRRRGDLVDRNLSGV